MKKLFFTLFFFGFCLLVSAQSTPKVGDELIIKEPYAQTFHFIQFPKPNMLMKRGTVTRYASVYENTVVINEVITKEDGDIQVTLKKKNGTKFFGFLSTVKANYAKAIEAEEMVAVP